jgi:hypothetical protein
MQKKIFYSLIQLAKSISYQSPIIIRQFFPIVDEAENNKTYY